MNPPKAYEFEERAFWTCKGTNDLTLHMWMPTRLPGHPCNGMCLKQLNVEDATFERSDTCPYKCYPVQCPVCRVPLPQWVLGPDKSCYMCIKRKKDLVKTITEMFSLLSIPNQTNIIDKFVPSEEFKNLSNDILEKIYDFIQVVNATNRIFLNQIDAIGRIKRQGAHSA